MVSSESSSSDLSEYTLFQIQKLFFFIYKNQFLGEKIEKVGFFLHFFLGILPKFSDFINSDSCILGGLITQFFLEPITLK